MNDVVKSGVFKQLVINIYNFADSNSINGASLFSSPTFVPTPHHRQIESLLTSTSHDLSSRSDDIYVHSPNSTGSLLAPELATQTSMMKYAIVYLLYLFIHPELQ